MKLSLPLAGLRVLDVSNVLAGPFCGYQLALMGAEVIKIEQPGSGDLARRLGADAQAAAQQMGASFVAVNAGKQSVTLNLKDREGKKIFEQLTAVSHVVLENFRPGVMQRLGLDYEALAKINSGIVYCAISGFGQSGPLAQRQAYDQIIQGIAGVMSVTGDETSAPLRVGYPVADTIGGMTAAFAICAALVDARASGRGRLIDVSMLEATLATMGWVVSNYLNAGVAPVAIGNQNATAAPSGTFRTGDGLLNIAANENRQYEALCGVIGRSDLKTDERFADRQSRKINRAALNEQIEGALAGRRAVEWEPLMIEAGVPVGRVMSVPEVLAEPHLAERRFVTEIVANGTVQRLTRSGFLLSDDDPAPRAPAPPLSQDTDRWLSELGYAPAEISRLREQGVI